MSPVRTLEVAFTPVQRGRTDGNNAVFLAFAKPDAKRCGLAVEVPGFEPGQLAAADRNQYQMVRPLKPSIFDIGSPTPFPDERLIYG